MHTSNSSSPPRRRLRKRVFVVAATLVGLVAYALYSEGLTGIIAVGKVLLVLALLWTVVWKLFLEKEKLFATLASVVFVATDDAKKPPMASRKKVVFD